MAKKADTQAKKKASQTVPNIVSFDEFLKLKGKQKGPLTIYFDEQQWKNLTKGMKPVEGKMPKKGIRLALFSSPLIAGGFGTLSCVPPGQNFLQGDSSSLYLAGGGLVNCPEPGSGVDIPDEEPVPVGGEEDDGVLVGGTGLRQCELSFSKEAGVHCAGTCPRKGSKCKLVWHTAKIGNWWHIWLTCVCQPLL